MANLSPNFQQTAAQLKTNLEAAAGNISIDGADLKKKLTSSLTSLSTKFDTAKIQSLTSKITSKDMLNLTTKLGGELNETIGGFQSLTKSVDDIVPKLTNISKPLQTTFKNFAQSLPNQSFAGMAQELQDVAGKIPVAQMTSQVKGLQDNLVRDLQSEVIKTKLQAITGKASLVASELTDVVIAAPLPEAMSAALGEVSTGLNFKIPVTEMQGILKEGLDLSVPLGSAVTAAEQALGGFDELLGDIGGGLDDVLKNIAGDGLNIAVNIPNLGNLTALTSGLQSSIKAELATVTSSINNGFSSLMSNAVEETFAPATNLLKGISSIDGLKMDLPKASITQIISLVEKNDLSSAVKIMKNFSDQADEQIANVLLSINNTAAAATASKTPGVEVAVSKVGDYIKGFKEDPSKWFTSGNWSFPIINSRDALIADINSVKKREITSVIIVSTQTGTNQPLTANTFSQLFYDKYKVGAPFNYIIHRSGKIEKGRPVDHKFPDALSNEYLQGDQLKWYDTSLVVFMVGGYNAPEGTPDIEKYASKQSYTADQFKSLNRFIASTLAARPGISIYGASDIGAGAGPYFNVQEMVQSKHNRTNAIPDLNASSTPPTIPDIALANGPF